MVGSSGHYHTSHKILILAVEGFSSIDVKTEFLFGASKSVFQACTDFAFCQRFMRMATFLKINFVCLFFSFLNPHIFHCLIFFQLSLPRQ